nr:hypothetical protein BEI47_17780 [Aliivibrio fischeri]
MYFDDLGKPWEKHPCTTNKRKSSRHLTSTVTNKRKVIDYTSSIYKPFIIEKISYPDMEWILIQAKYNNYKIQVKFARKKALDANLRKVTFCMAAKQDNAYLVSYLNETGQADVIKGYCV